MSSLKFTVNSVERETLDDFIFKIEFFVSLENVETKTIVHILDSVNLTRPDTLIPFKDLDEDTLVTWIKQSLGLDKLKALEEELKNKLNKIENSTTAFGLPWA